MSLEARPIDLLGVIEIVTKRWPLLLGVPVVITALVYFAVPAPSVSYNATASLATNGHPSLALIDQVTSSSQVDGRKITVQEDGRRVTVGTTVSSEQQATELLGPVLAQFASANLLDAETRKTLEATRERNDQELAILRESLATLQTSPATAVTDNYNPATYASAVVAIAARSNVLSTKNYDVNRELNQRLAVSGEVAYDLTEQRAHSRSVLLVVVALGSAFATLLWLLALEALKRRKALNLS
ncbi:MAG TPA: hypothetical protein VL147_14590 [Devosia sp.]|nr:hypothetical protein [Devosia sp.]